MKLIPLLLGAVVVMAQSGPTHDWHDATRDVYINNELDRSCQVLICDSPSKLAVISAKLDKALLLDMTQQSVSLVSKDAFRLSTDRTKATSDSRVVTQEIGKFTKIDGPIYSFAVEGRPVLIRSHPGVTGELNLEKLWETVPIWRGLMESYEPNAEAVAALKSTPARAKVTVAFGTWCPDSKNYVPRLLKAINAAGSPNIQVTLIGVDNQFREPIDTVQPRQITNVPTVIVERDGREVGRIVETPASKTIEEDLAAILAGKAIVHTGRWERGALVARGVYSYRDSEGKETGRESWELYGTAEGGYLAHSVIVLGELNTEVFERVDAKRRPTFAEITKSMGSQRTRTRINIDGHTMTARMRGGVSGVIVQTIEIPEQIFLWAPAVAIQGWSRTGEAKQISGYVTPGDFDKALGTICLFDQASGGEESVRVPAGEFRGLRVTRVSGNETSDWWLHSQLGMPLRGKIKGGPEYVLTSLELPKKD